MYIPDEVLKCVAFVCVKSDSENYIPGGTGFFVSVKEEKLNFIYFITAKHVVESIKKRDICIRINKKDGNVENTEIPHGVKWYTHPNDEDVDVTLIQIGIEEKFDIKTIPSDMFLTESHVSNRNIGIGEDVFITGLFTRYYGQNRNLPIIRVGNIAMLPNEKVYVGWHGGCKIDAYLIEARSIGGISGSPVFFTESAVKDGGYYLSGTPKLFLGGLIHGHWPVDESRIDNTLDISEEKNVNMGIAIVVPAIKIMEVLNQEELKEIRIRIEKESKQKSFN